MGVRSPSCGIWTIVYHCLHYFVNQTKQALLHYNKPQVHIHDENDSFEKIYPHSMQAEGEINIKEQYIELHNIIRSANEEKHISATIVSADGQAPSWAGTSTCTFVT